MSTGFLIDDNVMLLGDKHMCYPQDRIINFIDRTQPKSISKYKYLGGNQSYTCDITSEFHIFKVEQSKRKMIFAKSFYQYFKNLPNVEKSGNYYLVEIFMHPLVFVIQKTHKSESLCDLFVYNSNATYIDENTPLYKICLPNIHPNGKICQSSYLRIKNNYDNLNERKIKNSFELSEYYIDMFFQTSFNTDLSGIFTTNIKKYGFKDLYEFFNCVNSKDIMNRVEYLYQNPQLTDTPSTTIYDMFLYDKKDAQKAFSNISKSPNYNERIIHRITDYEYINLYIGDIVKYNDKKFKIIRFDDNIKSESIICKCHSSIIVTLRENGKNANELNVPLDELERCGTANSLNMEF